MAGERFSSLGGGHVPSVELVMKFKLLQEHIQQRNRLSILHVLPFRQVIAISDDQVRHYHTRYQHRPWVAQVSQVRLVRG
jgi:hypothetical protein